MYCIFSISKIIKITQQDLTDKQYKNINSDTIQIVPIVTSQKIYRISFFFIEIMSKVCAII